MLAREVHAAELRDGVVAVLEEDALVEFFGTTQSDGRVDGEITGEIEVDGQPWFAGSATTVVIANGQFLRGADIVPRGHPGDGRLEVQVYELRRLDEAWRVIALAAADERPVIVVTSALPPASSPAHGVLKRVTGPGRPIAGVVEMGTPAAVATLRDLIERRT